MIEPLKTVNVTLWTGGEEILIIAEKQVCRTELSQLACTLFTTHHGAI